MISTEVLRAELGLVIAAASHLVSKDLEAGYIFVANCCT